MRNTGCVGRRCPILNIASKMACTCGSGCGYLARFSRQLSTRLLWARLQSSLVPAVSVDDERVQELMRQLTGLDLDKVFSPRREPLQPPIYKLMTLNELEKAHEECVKEAKTLLRMPPVLPEREPKGAVIEVDKGLAEATIHRMIFTDTTQHMDDKDRQIVVREIDGTLREANWEERDRMCQMFFPKLGRKMWLPMMFRPEQLPEVLSLGHHLTVLDCVCVQCAPDSAEYIRVHRAVYDDIEKKSLYEMLWSTRYFGCLVWHLLTSDTITGLLKHMVKMKRLQDAAGLVELHLLCYPSSHFSLSLKETKPLETASDTILAFCKYFGLQELSKKLSESIEMNDEQDKINGDKAQTKHSTLS